MSRRPPVVGHYVHHQGSGHLHRGMALGAALEAAGARVTLLSSCARPGGWSGGWVDLPRDDDPAAARSDDPTAAGRLHWAPLRHVGLRSRAAALSAWIERARPDVLVSDVSQEVTLLARLHGVPVVSVVLPGHRCDPAHLLGLGVSSDLVGFWPASAVGMLPGLPDDLAGRVRPVGGLSRFDPAPARPAGPHARPGRHAVALFGTGGGAPGSARLRALGAALDDWTWTTLGPDSWVEDPSTLLWSASVLVIAAGQNSVAEAAAVRVPAVVVPAPRPHDEQVTTAAVLHEGPWPTVVLPAWTDDGWAERLELAAGLDPAAWEDWVDGRATDRFADVVLARAGRDQAGAS